MTSAGRAWPDALAASLLVLLLVPAVLIDAILWYEHFSGIALYDPAVGGNPAWTHRPLVAPVLVLVCGAVRLGLSRVWLLAPRYRIIFAVLTVVASLTALASHIREPEFSYLPH